MSWKNDIFHSGSERHCRGGGGVMYGLRTSGQITSSSTLLWKEISERILWTLKNNCTFPWPEVHQISQHLMVQRQPNANSLNVVSPHWPVLTITHTQRWLQHNDFTSDDLFMSLDQSELIHSRVWKSFVLLFILLVLLLCMFIHRGINSLWNKNTTLSFFLQIYGSL